MAGVYPLIVAVNLLVGFLVGSTGLGGFLLPIVFIGSVGLGVRASFAVSFVAFLVFGVVGTITYWKSKNIDIKFSLVLSIGSLIGSLLGVKINSLLPDQIVKLVLSLFVICVAITLLLKKQDGETKHDVISKGFVSRQPVVIALGFITGLLSSLTGSGGPLIVVPLLIALGIEARTAVGISLLNSIVIAIPAAIGYLISSGSPKETLPMMIFGIFGQIPGVIAGTVFANKLNGRVLQKGIAVVTLISACYMFVRLFV